MSGTLVARIKKPAKWKWHFKNPLRDKINDRFQNGLILPADIDYLVGLRDACNDDRDIGDLTNIIEALLDGNEIEFKVEY